MTRPDVTARAAELRSSRVPFVHARVVRAERPTSAKPGDEAIVLADGTIEGFVGGNCAEAAVREQSLALLDAGEPLIVRITPTPEHADPEPGRVVVHNPCLSGGSIEVFLQPEVPAPLVVVAGQAPIAAALIGVGREIGYDVRAYDGEIEPDAAAVVVASHGRGEEGVLNAALGAGVPYVGLVASARRGRAVVESLGVAAGEGGRVRTPAGLDIGARTPGEIAVSILAEIVATRPRPVSPPQKTYVPDVAGIDPVCGMSVAAGADAMYLDHGEGRLWFCGSGCLHAFRADPAAYST